MEYAVQLNDQTQQQFFLNQCVPREIANFVIFVRILKNQGHFVETATA